MHIARARNDLRLRALCGLVLVVCLQLGLLLHTGQHEAGSVGCETCTVLGHLGDAMPPAMQSPGLAATSSPLPMALIHGADRADDAVYQARAPPWVLIST